MTTEGKNAAISAGAAEVLPKLLTDSSTSVVLAAVKAITTVAEHPTARKQFAPLVPQVRGDKLRGGGPSIVTYCGPTPFLH